MPNDPKMSSYLHRKQTGQKLPTQKKKEPKRPTKGKRSGKRRPSAEKYRILH